MSVTLAVTVTSSWNGGFGATLSITNNNPYTIQSYSLSMNSPTTNITWASNFAISTAKDGIVNLTGQSWLTPLAPGATFIEAFGGTGTAPPSSAFTFNQINPPLVPVDPTIRGNFGAQTFVPYVDVTAYPTFDLIGMAKTTGQLFYTLAFVVSDTHQQPLWAGSIPMSTNYFVPQIDQLRAMGGDVIISFGGANGVELAQAITNVTDLVTAYQTVIDLYSLRRIDFDIEGGAVADPISVNRRNQAIAILQKKYPLLKVSYCLPALPTGLTADGLNLLKNAISNGVRVDIVNQMDMDFGDSVYNPATTTMSQACISAAQSMHTQLLNLGLTSTTVGVIAMIGVNDVSNEIFKLTDAAVLVKFAQSTSWISTLSFWSVNRDVANSTPLPYASGSDSSIVQNAFDFTNIFKAYNSSGSVPAPIPVPTPINVSFNINTAGVVSNFSSSSNTAAQFKVSFTSNNGIIGNIVVSAV